MFLSTVFTSCFIFFVYRRSANWSDYNFSNTIGIVAFTNFCFFFLEWSLDFSSLNGVVHSFSIFINLSRKFQTPAHLQENIHLLKNRCRLFYASVAFISKDNVKICLYSLQMIRKFFLVQVCLLNFIYNEIHTTFAVPVSIRILKSSHNKYLK